MDVPRQRRRRSWSSLALRAIAIVTAFVTPAIAFPAWLLLADPVVAADVAASGDLWPLMDALVDAVGAALEAALAYL